MANVRTYRSAVKIGNWYENLCLEEDLKRKYLEKKEKGELSIQRIDYLKYNILRPVDMTVTNDGFLHFGDAVMLVHTGRGKNDYLALNVNADINNLITSPTPGIKAPCGVSAGRAQACIRTTFIITSVDGSPVGSPLCYEQSFALKATGIAAGGTIPQQYLFQVRDNTPSWLILHELYLISDAKSFQKCAKLSRLQDVYLDVDESFLSRWKILYFDPQERFENEGYPVHANVKVLIVHCKTNQALAVWGNEVLWTLFGNEYEVTAHTFLDSHKAEKEQNHWLVYAPYPAEQESNPFRNAMSSAGSEELTQEKLLLLPVGPPTAGAQEADKSGRAPDSKPPPLALL